MPTTAELNLLTARELGLLAKEISIAGWHEMKKGELAALLPQRLRSKLGKEVFEHFQKQKERHEREKAKKRSGADVSDVSDVVSTKNEKELLPSGKSKKLLPGGQKKELPRQREMDATTSVSSFPTSLKSKKMSRDLSSPHTKIQEDKLVLLVRDPYWLHAFWELSSRSIDRAKAAMGPFWHTAVPILRLFQFDTEGAAQPRRQHVRDTVIHSGVNNWYLDVKNPPSKFVVELGYLSREKKFFKAVSSNTVETPQHQVRDDFDQLDGNWRGVADDLGRVFKLSGGEDINPELKKIFEDQLGRPMSMPMLSRYRASQYGNGEQAQRNFSFDVDADVIIHGQADPGVLLSIRNEPIAANLDGTFSVRFSLPEKRHMFQVKAEGNDGVETQQVILTIERNTRILETLVQEPNDED